MHGFTLPELVAVIVLVAALGVVALPRFLALDDEAHSAAAAATGGALQAGVNLIQAQWAAQGQGSSVTESGVTVQVNAAGWPLPQPASGAGCLALWGALLSSAPPVDAAAFVQGDPGWFAFPFAGGCGYLFQPDIDPLRLVVYTPTSGGSLFGEPLVAGTVLFVEL